MAGDEKTPVGLEPEELQAAAAFMIRTSGTPETEEWGIFDHENFGGYEVSEWSSFDTVSLVAQGIAERGKRTLPG
jgi:antirestriction protein